MLSQVYCRTVGLFVICKFISGVLLLHYVLINCDLRLSSQVYCGMFWLIVIYVFCLRCTVVFCDLDVCHFQCAIDVLIVIYVFLRGTVVFWLWFACLLFPVCYRCFDYLWFVCSSSQVYCNTFWLICLSSQVYCECECDAHTSLLRTRLISLTCCLLQWPKKTTAFTTIHSPQL